jgi:hypothetical protein
MIKPERLRIQFLFAIVSLFLFAFECSLFAQPPSNAARTETVIAGEQYAKVPGAGRFMLGNNYRDLWTVPVEIQVLDLQTTAGGLKPVRLIGGNESRGLALKGNDGRDYSFRPVKKDLRKIVPPEFQDSIVEDIVQDQISATVPGVEVIKPLLARAVGVLAVDSARLIVLPDDPALGEFRQEFAHALGVFLEFPQPQSATNPGFHGATEILGADDFWEKRRASSDTLPDSRALLRARVLDIFLNDWDRHHHQWRWARIPGEARLQPIPEDPDMALSDYEGLALGAARFMRAPFVTFDGDFSPLPAATKNGWPVDRFLLSDLEHADWSKIAADVQSRLTDPVIENAIAQFPAEYRRLRGEQFVSTLKQRRDNLVQYVDRFYRYLADEVDIHGSDDAEAASVEWMDGGDLQVTVSSRSSAGAANEPFYRRRFNPDETNEVRIYLHAGDDSLVVRGRPNGRIKVRAIGGSGTKSIDDPERSVRLYDSEGEMRSPDGSRLDVKDENVTVPVPVPPNDLPWTPLPDWGGFSTPVVTIGYSSDPGFILGGGIDIRKRGFRKYPWASRHRIEAAWAFGASKPFIDYTGAFRRENSDVLFAISARFSGIEQLRYYGLGNETPFDDQSRFSKVSSYQTEIFPALVFNPNRRTRVAVGPYFQYSDSSGDSPSGALESEQSLGIGSFSELGARLQAKWDTRTSPDVFARGIEINVIGKYFAKVFDVEEAFGSLGTSVDIVVPAGDRLVWNVKAGGKKVWGEYPFFEAAYVDHRTTPGYAWNRFAGDGSLYGSTTLYMIMSRLRNKVSGEFGLSVFAAAGRVYLNGEDSSKWHPSGGLGVFYTPFRRTTLVGAKVGKSAEKWFFSLETRLPGFTF